MAKSAEDWKAEGNTAFAAKKFTEAIGHYSEAIKLDAKNHIFFSNRSASYAGVCEYAKAIADAKECIRLNPSFAKGYHRLATAQMELKDWDGASATIRQGLEIDKENDHWERLRVRVEKEKKAMLQKQRHAKNLQMNSNGSGSGIGRDTLSAAIPSNLDEATTKELRELQERYMETNREFNSIKANISALQREAKIQELTKGEIEGLPDCTTVYQGVGKMFMLSTRDEAIQHIVDSIDNQGKKEIDLNKKMEYLARRMKSHQQNIEELRKA
mmetsp:Transcript_14997/g.22837  ORF Transcript_14997/g.22837 Transcript_14997/m.22837 type:complete len:271 (+) Transcript_14997:39-851(+)